MLAVDFLCRLMYQLLVPTHEPTDEPTHGARNCSDITAVEK